MPNNFYSMTAGEQWRSIVIHCKIRDSSMILDILGSPIPKESLLEIFPNAGRTNKVFEDDTRITMPLSQLRALEDSLSNERSEYDVRKTKRQMDQNNKRIKAPVEYAATQDNLETDVHPRLLHNFTLVDPVKVSEDMTRNNVQPIPTDLYPLQHINGGGCITLKGWFEAANLGSTTISLKDFLLKNALRANSGARRVTSGQDNGTHFLESEIPLEEVTCLGDCMEGFCMLMLARSRACPADCSMEPINRFISAHVYFIGDTKHKPDGVNPGVFSAAFIDHVLKQNGLRYSTKMPFLVYTELHQTLDEFKMTIKGTRSNDNQRQDHKHNNKQNNKNTRSKGKDGNSTLTCFRFNNPKGNQCSKSDGECTGKHGAVYRHLCNFKFSGGNTCNKPHPVSQHGTNFKKED